MRSWHWGWRWAGDTDGFGATVGSAVGIVVESEMVGDKEAALGVGSDAAIVVGSVSEGRISVGGGRGRFRSCSSCWV